MVWTTFLIPVVAIICVFTFVTISTWAENRRKEREEYYKNETYQKMLDGSVESAETVRSLIREAEERQEARRRHNLKMGLKLGGMITMVAGISLGIFLYQLLVEGTPKTDDDAVFLVALIPILVGLVLAVYGFFVRAPESQAGTRRS